MRIHPRATVPVSHMLAAMLAVELCSGVVQGYLPPLLPALGLHLHIDTAGQSDVYLLSQLSPAVLTPLLSRLGDLYGHRRMLRGSLATVALGSLLMAVWPSSTALMVGVVLQGATVGFLPLMLGILRSRAPHRNRSGIGLLVGALLVAIGVGALVAGMLSEHRAETGLWVSVPVALLALVAGFLLPDSSGERGGRFNVSAAVLLTGGLVGTVLTLAQGPVWGWSSHRIVGSAVVGFTFLVLWALVEYRSAKPLVDVRMFANRRLAVVCGITFCLSFATIGYLGANATFLGASTSEAGYGIGLGPRAIAVIALIMVLAGFVGSLLARRLAHLLGDRFVLLTSAGIATVGFVSMIVLHDTLVEYLCGALVVGFANGLSQAITRTLSVEALDVDDTALAAGVNELALSLGAALGSASISAIFAAHPWGHTGYVQLAGYLWSWGVCAAVTLLGAALALCYRNVHGTVAERTHHTPAQDRAAT